MELSSEHGSTELTLPAAPYAMLDALQKLRLADGEAPRWEILRINTANGITPTWTMRAAPCLSWTPCANSWLCWMRDSLPLWKGWQRWGTKKGHGPSPCPGWSTWPTAQTAAISWRRPPTTTPWAGSARKTVLSQKRMTFRTKRLSSWTSQRLGGSSARTRAGCSPAAAMCRSTMNCGRCAIPWTLCRRNLITLSWWQPPAAVRSSSPSRWASPWGMSRCYAWTVPPPPSPASAAPWPHWICWHTGWLTWPWTVKCPSTKPCWRPLAVTISAGRWLWRMGWTNTASPRTCWNRRTQPWAKSEPRISKPEWSWCEIERFWLSARPPWRRTGAALAAGAAGNAERPRGNRLSRRSPERSARGYGTGHQPAPGAGWIHGPPGRGQLRGAGHGLSAQWNQNAGCQRQW